MRPSLHVLLIGLLMAWLPGLASGQATFDHRTFDDLLAAYVDADGMVDYAGIQQNREHVLDPYLEALAEADASALSSDEAFAFWINAYNALAIDLIVRHYPVDDIFETHDENPFEKEVGMIAGHELSLDELEHNFIDDQFDDPRFHFAIVCAAMSCPPLRTEAYTGDRIDEQLQDQAETFIHGHEDNQIAGQRDRIAISTIFDWFKDDFGGGPEGMQRYLADFFEGDTRKQLKQGAYEVSFTDYDWTLNDQTIATARR